jgi:hypothetical protein
MASETIETAKKKFSSYKNKKAVPDNQIFNILSEETLKYLLLEYVFYISSIALLLALLIYNHNKNLALEEKLVQINKELQQQQVTFEKRQKPYNEKIKLAARRN